MSTGVPCDWWGHTVDREKLSALRKKLLTRRKRSAVSASKKLARRTPLRSLWWWLSLVVLAASAGFIPPAIAMAFAVTEGWDGQSQFWLLIVAGLFQGLALGIAEVIALRRGPLRVPAGRWIFVTTLAMGVAWLVALLPGTFVQLDWSNPAVVVAIIGAVLVVVLIVPLGQWFILRSRTRDAWRWMLVMGVATTLGVGSLLSGIVLAAGKTTFISTLLPFILTGWVGIVLFTVVSGLGVYWIAREAYTAADISDALARRAAKASRATTATKKAAARVGAKASPAIKNMASSVATAAKKAGSQTSSAVKITATRVTSRASMAITQAKARAKARGPERAKAQAKKTSGK